MRRILIFFLNLQLSIFSHRFMSITDQMGRYIQCVVINFVCRMVDSENTLVVLSMHFCYLSPKEFFKGHQSLLISRYMHFKSWLQSYTAFLTCLLQDIFAFIIHWQDN